MEGLAIETEDEEVGARSEPTFLRILQKQNTEYTEYTEYTQLIDVCPSVCVSQVWYLNFSQ